MRTVDLARAAGVSTQQIRNYEEAGLLPPVPRTDSGYRTFDERHLKAVLAYRALAAGHGPEAARGIMHAVLAGDVAGALALVDAGHAALHEERASLRTTAAALEAVAAAPGGRSAAGAVPVDGGPASLRAAVAAAAGGPVVAGVGPVDGGSVDGPRLVDSGPGGRAGAVGGGRPGADGVAAPGGGIELSVGELAAELGVRPSALRVWEAAGLLSPRRERITGYRRYGPADVRDARMIRMLRQSWYPLPRIAPILEGLRRTGSSDALREAVAHRQAELTRRSAALLDGAAHLSRYLADFPPG
ncbi:hypothetical protein GCM10022251_68040 [Phytohabitans flavus]|uniref:HTH merR-type domain-containing protein n=1 Tax=Phytohabitans flavus TaxID=1076124 RepID=A0A6F8XQN1_9ACTN|nr:MerR family transcriptional regulator [Phytohabitans flavus]BCB76130.1 hypothetical protein Pflav_025400 [Phytohabitans flavus]